MNLAAHKSKLIKGGTWNGRSLGTGFRIGFKLEKMLKPNRARSLKERIASKLAKM